MIGFGQRKRVIPQKEGVPVYIVSSESFKDLLNYFLAVLDIDAFLG